MTLKFAEIKQEQSFTALLGNKGHLYFVGSGLERDSENEVLITD